MTELQMMQKLEEARQDSERFEMTVWSLGNGEEIRSSYSPLTVKEYKEMGYWVVSIFENGHRVEA